MNHLTATAGFCALLLLFSQCKKDKAEEKTHVIGQKFQGGIIAYLLTSRDAGYDSTKQHGIIVAEADLNSGDLIAWGPLNTNISGTSYHIGMGRQNTDLLVSQIEGQYAAHICNELQLNGYDDWFLPSLQELYEIAARKDSIGTFHNQLYWSSSMSGVPGRTNAIVFKDATIAVPRTVDVAAAVRPIRYF